jgi:hypothetical protein
VLRSGILAMALLWVGGVLEAQAQTRPPDEVRHTFALVGVPLPEALDHLIDRTNLSLVFTSEMVAGRTTWCTAARVTAEALLACVLRDTGLDYVRLSSGTYVLIVAPQARPRYARLTGQVRDAGTGQPLPDANVLLVGEALGVATNADGRFAFAALRPGTHRLVVTHVSYEAAVDTLYVAPGSAGHMAVALTPRVVLTAPVVVQGFETRLPSDALGQGTLEPEAPHPPAGIGTPDVVQHLEAVVGVHLGDALSDVHVQGGAANEQQFLLDGVPVYVPVANGGFIGPFSPFAIGQVTVRKAGFGAAYGSGLSGMIELHQHLASQAPVSASVQVDPLSLNTRWTGRLGAPERRNMAWMVVTRNGLWDAFRPVRLQRLFRDWSTPDPFLLETLQAEDERLPDTASVPGALEVGFRDLHVATHLRFGGLRSVRLSVYQGVNRFGVERAVGTPGTTATEGPFEDAWRWRNRTARLRYEWVQGRRLFAHTEAWATDYALVHPVVLGSAGATGTASEDLNEVSERGLRVGGDLAASARHMLSGAVEAAHTGSDVALSLDPFGAVTATTGVVRPVRWRMAAFAEDRFAVRPHTLLTAGLRLTGLPGQQTVYAEPRLSLQHDRTLGQTGSWAVRTAVGLYRQYIHAFDVATYNVTSLLPQVRFWLPVGRDQHPPRALHGTVGVLLRPDATWTFGVEGFYKHQPHLLVLDYGRWAVAQPGEAVLRPARGYAGGMALSAAWKRPRLHSSMQYAYTRARRQVANRFAGAFTPVPWEVPHHLTFALDVLPRPHWTATLRWQGLWGRSWGFRQGYYDYLEPNPATRQLPPFDLSDPAAHRLPAFSQWDAGLAYARTVRGVRLQGRVMLINLLGHRNVIDWSLRHDARTATYQRQARHAIAFFPSFALRLGR